MNEFDVRVYAIYVRKDRRKPYMVRWAVGGKRYVHSLTTRALADNLRSKVMQSARKGERFDPETGFPVSMIPDAPGVTWFDHAFRYAEMKWAGAAGKTRIATAEALATVTPALVTDGGGRPDAGALRAALSGWAFNVNRRGTEAPHDVRRTLEWVAANSLPLSVFNDPAARTGITREALDACTQRLDGSPAAATTARRKRAVLYNALGWAVELGHITANPIDAVQWKTKHVADEVDRRVVASPEQVRQLLAAVTYVGRRTGEHLAAFFALLYFAALRPSEALALRVQDCELPASGWGRLLLDESRPEVGRAWTDDGQRTERRSLKWRAAKEVRPVPIPPELVTLLRSHVGRYGNASDGRLFRTALSGDVTRSAYYRAWTQARALALPPQVAASPVAGRPYDLRHAGVTLWLNSGMPAPEVARRAGHSVDVLLRIYAGCIDGGEGSANRRVEEALGGSAPDPHTHQDDEKDG